MLLKAQKGKNGFGRYFATIVLIILASQVLGAIPLLIAILCSANPITDASAVSDSLISLKENKNLYLLLMLIPFAIGFLALILSVRWIHKRTFSDITTGFNHFRLKHFFKGFIIWTSLSILIILIYLLITPEEFIFNANISEFLILFCISIVFIPMQTGFEELLFRGYLYQGLGLLSKNKWVSLVINSLIFGGLHILNPEVKEFGYALAMPQYITWGLVMGFITIKDNGLEIAWGVHTANNLCAALFITHSSSAFQTQALFKVTQIHPEWDLVTLFVSSAIFVFICYKTFNWSDKTPITEPISAA